MTRAPYGVVRRLTVGVVSRVWLRFFRARREIDGGGG
jgi:hypothetical protein